MKQSVLQAWIDWCYGDTTTATENDWNRFVKETYDVWAEDKSGCDESLDELDGDEWDTYYEEHYSQDVFFDIAEENEELSEILNHHFNMASVSWEVVHLSKENPNDGMNTIIKFNTEFNSNYFSNEDDYEEITLNELRSFHLKDLLMSENQSRTGTWGRDDPSDPSNEIRKLLAYYLKYREE